MLLKKTDHQFFSCRTVLHYLTGTPEVPRPDRRLEKGIRIAAAPSCRVLLFQGNVQFPAGGVLATVENYRRFFSTIRAYL